MSKLVTNFLRSWLEKRPALTRAALDNLARNQPVLSLGQGTKLILGHDQVLDVLERSNDFQLADSVEPRLRSGPFLLTTEPPGQYDTDKADLRGASYGQPNYLESVTKLVSDETVQRLASADGSIDVVCQLLEPIATEVAYQFIIGPTGTDKHKLQLALRSMAKLIIATDPYNSRLRREAKTATDYIESLVRISIKNPDQTSVTRNLAVSKVPEDDISRLVVGLAATATATIARAGGQALDQLLRRPKALEGAQTFARQGDKNNVLHYIFEALRFHPMFFFIPRTAIRKTTIRTEGKLHPINQGDNLLVGLFPAMFDSMGFAEPLRFLPNRPIDSYLHFGSGPHRCFGARLAELQLKEILTELLVKDGLTSLPGRKGQLKYDGAAVIGLNVAWSKT